MRSTVMAFQARRSFSARMKSKGNALSPARSGIRIGEGESLMLYPLEIVYEIQCSVRSRHCMDHVLIPCMCQQVKVVASDLSSEPTATHPLMCRCCCLNVRIFCQEFSLLEVDASKAKLGRNTMLLLANESKLCYTSIHRLRGSLPKAREPIDDIISALTSTLMLTNPRFSPQKLC